MPDCVGGRLAIGLNWAVILLAFTQNDASLIAQEVVALRKWLGGIG